MSLAADPVDEHVQWVRTASHPLGAGTFYLHQDARGSVVAVTDQGGAVVDKVRYDDFGRADHASAVGLALGFQGRYLDAETGLYEFRHRVYDPATGRFLQRDPVWDPANAGNQYGFAGNGPTNWGDPNGTSKAKALATVLRKAGQEGANILGHLARAANRGEAPPHGSRAHNDAINRVAAAMDSQSYTDIRKNQRQVDAEQIMVGGNRPDIAGNSPKSLTRVNVEFDTDPMRAVEPMGEVVANDPSAISVFVILDKASGRPVGSVTYKPDTGFVFGRGTKELLEKAEQAYVSKLLQRSGSFAATLLAPNAQLADKVRGTAEDVAISGLWDIATFLDPINLTGAVDTVIDRQTQAETPSTASRLLRMAWRGLWPIDPFDPLGLELVAGLEMDALELVRRAEAQRARTCTH